MTWKLSKSAAVRVIEDFKDTGKILLPNKKRQTSNNYYKMISIDWEDGTER